MESWQRWIYGKNCKGLIINKITKKGNAERILNTDDAMLNTFSLGMKSNGYGRNEGGDIIGDMVEFNYCDTLIKMTTMIL